ncbi:MAG TPA: cyclic nucleotide-binding domain-containing protein [Chloroflexota bacterium]|nr:cyclic nucleotide-binding domain-containing protein [Chloroflexota bacterium]
MAADASAVARRTAARAALLGRVDLFSGLDRIARSKLAAYLDPVFLAAGQNACVQGEPGDSLYIVSEGALGVFLVSRDDTGVEEEIDVATLGEGQCFGEMALLTGEPRAATVRALTDAEALRLERGRFIELLRREPAIGLEINATLSRRLRDANTTITRDLHALEETVAHGLRALAPDTRELALRAALLERPHRAALEAVFGERAAEVEAALAELGLTAEGTRGEHPPSPVRRVLRDRLRREVEEREIERRATDAAERLVDAGLGNDALAVLEENAPRGAFLRALAGLLQRSGAGSEPAAGAEGAPAAARVDLSRWLARVTEDEAASDATLTLARATWLRRQEAPLEAHVAERHPRPDRVSARPATIATTGVAVGLVVAAALVGRQSPPAGFLLLLAAAMTLWATALLPEFSVALGLAAAWVMCGVATPAQAFGGYGSPSFVTVIAILGLAAATSSSGLLFRAGLVLVRRMPSELLGQALTFLATGLVLTPLLPSSTARSALVTPLALTAAQSQRLRDRSPEAALLGLAAYVGGGPLLFTFLNGSTTCLLVWGLLPEASRARFDYTTWLLAAAPLALLVAAGSLAALFLVLRPRAQAGRSASGVDLQLSVLGRISRVEVGMAVILVLTILGWNAAPTVGIHISVVAVAALFAAVAVRAFTRQTLSVLNWDFIVGYGVVLSLSSLTVSLGLSERGAAAIRAAVGEAGVDPTLAVLGLAVAHLLVRLLLPMDPSTLIMSLAFIPVAPVLRVDPWVVIVTLLATSAPWFFPAQLPGYQVAYDASEGRLFSHGQARAVCAAYYGVTLLALALCVPYWRLLGLVS